jgi:hypothetical protein
VYEAGNVTKLVLLSLGFADGSLLGGALFQPQGQTD